MTLQSSGPISAGDINVELGRARAAAFSIGGATERALAGVPSGAISFSHFYGKTHGGGGGSAPVAALTATAAVLDRTHTGVSFGTAAGDRRIVVAAHWNSLTTLSSATIGGVAATIHASPTPAGGGGPVGVAIISAAVPTGTSGTVVLNFVDNGSVSKTAIGVYRVTGLASGTPHDTEATSVEFSTSISGAINVPELGLLIVGVTGDEDLTTSIAFTGATETYDTQGVMNGRYGGALQTSMSAQSNRTIGATWSLSGDLPAIVMAAATFR